MGWINRAESVKGLKADGTVYTVFLADLTFNPQTRSGHLVVKLTAHTDSCGTLTAHTDVRFSESDGIQISRQVFGDSEGCDPACRANTLKLLTETLIRVVMNAEIDLAISGLYLGLYADQPEAAVESVLSVALTERFDQMVANVESGFKRAGKIEAEKERQRKHVLEVIEALFGKLPADDETGEDS